MEIKVLNSDSELNSFPVTQTIRLKLNQEVDVSTLESGISLFNVISRDSLLRLSEPYNYNLGLAKENFDEVPLKFTLTPDTSVPGEYILEILPKKTLKVSSNYILFISKYLSLPYLSTTKTISKSNSSVSTIKDSNITIPPMILNIKVLETNKIKDSNTNLLKIRIEDSTEGNPKDQVLNLAVKPVLFYKGLNIKFESKIYVSDEEFTIRVNNQFNSDEDFSLTLRTSGSEDVVPMTTLESSNKISNQTILDYYQAINVSNVEIQTDREYLDSNVLLIRLDSNITKSQIDINNITYNLRTSFNNYILKNINLYNTEYKYILKLFWDEFENGILIVLEYADNSQLDLITVDVSEW